VDLYYFCGHGVHCYASHSEGVPHQCQ